MLWAQDSNTIIFGIVIVILVFIGLATMLILFNFMRLYLQAWLTGAHVTILHMIRMKLCNVDYGLVVKQKIALVSAGVDITTQQIEEHVLARGNIQRVTMAVIAAKKAGITLTWQSAAAIDLAGRDVYDAVRCSVNPKVIDCPDPSKGRQTLDGVCKNGIQLKARARVTVRTKLDRLVGGATEETIIARVGEGIVKAIGSAEDHSIVLANPNLISQAVLHNSLDSQTAFEIVSIDVAEIDVGQNVGANLQADQAAADLRVAQANAEKRRALAVALAQENMAKVEENRALVLQAESEIPRAIAHAIKDGKLGVMDFYNMKNLQADTQMRVAIAGSAGVGAPIATDRPEKPA
ncbi:MAG: UPF0365 family protein [Gemmataceae bacterium]|nr:UPF0365 family protein [Gemmataceae bacterium]